MLGGAWGGGGRVVFGLRLEVWVVAGFGAGSSRTELNPRTISGLGVAQGLGGLVVVWI